MSPTPSVCILLSTRELYPEIPIPTKNITVRRSELSSDLVIRLARIKNSLKVTPAVYASAQLPRCAARIYLAGPDPRNGGAMRPPTIVVFATCSRELEKGRLAVTDQGAAIRGFTFGRGGVVWAGGVSYS